MAKRKTSPLEEECIQFLTTLGVKPFNQSYIIEREYVIPECVTRAVVVQYSFKFSGMRNLSVSADICIRPLKETEWRSSFFMFGMGAFTNFTKGEFESYVERVFHDFEQNLKNVMGFERTA